MKSLLRFGSRALVAVLALGVLSWFVGQMATDRWEWSQWLWWIPTPIALTAALLGACVLLARTVWMRGSKVALLLGIAVVLLIGAYFSLVEHRLLSRERQGSGGVLIMHWNWTHATPQRVDLHVDQVLELNPDIAVMTDWQRLWRHSKEHERLEPTWSIAAMSSFTILSKYPITRARPIIANDTTQVGLVEIDTTAVLGRPIVMLLVDLPSDPDVGRMNHMEDVRAMMATADVAHVDVALGDFNVPRGSASLKAMLPDMHHAFRDGGHGYVATFHRAFPLYHIDHILLSETVRAIEYTTHDPGFGRHRAQLARIVLTDVQAPDRAP